MRLWVPLALALAAAWGMQAQVIAGPPAIDQSAERGGLALPPTAAVPEAAPARTPHTIEVESRSRTGAVVLLGLAAVSLIVVVATGWHRLDGAQQRAARMPAAAIGLFLAIIILREVGGAAARAIFGIDLSDGASRGPSVAESAQIALGAFGAAALGVGAYLCLRAGHRAQGARFSLVRAALVGAGALVLVLPLVQASAEVASWMLEAPRAPIVHDILQALVETPRDSWWWTLTALVIVAGPVIEEVMYRGLLQGALAQAGARGWPAIALTSAVFTLMHWPIVETHALPALFVLSLGFGWAFEKTGRLTAPIVMHVLFNAGNLTLALLTSGAY